MFIFSKYKVFTMYTNSCYKYNTNGISFIKGKHALTNNYYKFNDF